MGQQNFGNQGEPPYNGQQRQGPAPIGPHVGQGGQSQQGYDPRQYPSQQNMGYPQQPGYDQQQYNPNAQVEAPYGEAPVRSSALGRLNVPSWFPRDPTTLGILAAGGLAIGVCLFAFCLVLLMLNAPVPAPEEPGAQATSPVVIPPTTIGGFATANPFVTPTISLPGPGRPTGCDSASCRRR